MAEQRAIWRARQAGLDSERLVFIGETWVTTNMTRLRGRAVRGQRVPNAVPPRSAIQRAFLPRDRVSTLRSRTRLSRRPAGLELRPNRYGWSASCVGPK